MNRYFFMICEHERLFSASQIDRFAKQQPALEIQLKNINQGFSKYLERHTEVYEHDIQRVGELFTKLHLVVQTDSSTTGRIHSHNIQLIIIYSVFSCGGSYQ